MKRQRIQHGGNEGAAGIILYNPTTLEHCGRAGYWPGIRNWTPRYEIYKETEPSGLRWIEYTTEQRDLAFQISQHWPGIRRFRVNRLAFKLQEALKYLMFNIRWGLTRRLDWYGNIR